ncbi:MAG: hypothetical protein HOA15_09570 [Candidatus Marinimicrobia bacterium]|jgi:hypothetical protein|nr:hypothetical protein [Candidatus Neomarinimicrobiota bacterium]MBT3676695.1 hypothetical protein [Candidatus Neomarinimicrobiota bacterium]MBT3762318.1 hypothetical protein [Candidatus Neomarinimicrobiota bacterium]MBT4069418.1 hypothetical protein [Candidatus Neomarinimicrobiota bacterium]MBT4271470.1 hypothetical protein [Candidatus Neomarinimicrobiota bacterium]
MNHSILPIILLVSLFIACEDKAKPDKTPPELMIISPAAGETFRDTVFIQVDTKDEKGIAFVEFFINDSLHFTDSTLNYEYNWDTKKAPNGEYTIKVVSVDEATNKIEKSVTISILNLPGDYYPDKIVNFYLWGMEIEKPFIYAALDREGLWRKNYINEFSDWEYLGFSDTNFSAGAANVSVNGDHIIVANGIKHFWHSTDGGITWANTKLNYYGDDREKTLYLYRVEMSPHNPNIVLAQEGGRGIFQSVDGGYNWDLVYGAVDNSQGFSYIDWHPYKEEYVWLWGRINRSEEGVVTVIGANGLSLIHETDFNSDFNPKTAFIFDLVFNANNRDVLYSIGSWYEIYKSMDGGLTWTIIRDNPDRDEFYKYLLEDPNSSNSYFLFSGKNIFYSNDEFNTIRLVKTLDQSIDHPVIKDNILFYYTREDIKFISLNSIEIN